MFCSLRYNAPKLLSAGSLDAGNSNCKTQSSAHEDGQRFARNILSRLKLLIKLSLLHLFGHRYYLCCMQSVCED